MCERSEQIFFNIVLNTAYISCILLCSNGPFIEGASRNNVICIKNGSLSEASTNFTLVFVPSVVHFIKDNLSTSQHCDTHLNDP